MENVVAFNNELSGLYDTKPPISKAKMASITKAAMRAIKFYKHVVQSVEKFILKCKPEYKVPGLYVIDSIVRQSRHQYGPEKDVFAPRFARNIKETFANLFRCAPEDKSRIIRVLNLWQKNNVFAPDVIQPIFDLADPNHPIYQMPPAGMSAGVNAAADISNVSNGLLNSSMASLDNSMHASGSGVNIVGGIGDDKMGAGLPDLSNNNLKQLLNDPNVLRQLQTLQNFTKFKQQEDKQHKLNEMRLQEDAFEKHLQSVLKSSGGNQNADSNEYNAEVEFVSMEQNIEVINLDGNDSRSPTPDRDRYKRRRTRSRSRSRDRRGNSRERRRRSRSRSTERSRSPRTNRRRMSRERERNNRDKERDREHERERRKKGLPELKKEHLSVCSTTLWVGHLSKLVYQEELSDTFGEFGDIVSIDQIVPRGCAFIVMNRRQDAYKAMQNLKNHKLQGRAITISWAAGKGVKSKEWKDYWDLELGVTYIPWNKLDENTDLDSLEEGGMFDEDSMPNWMKEKIRHLKSLKDKIAENTNQPNNVPPASGMMFGIDTTQPPPAPPGPPPLMPMTMPGQFSMAPPMGAPQRPILSAMGMPLTGLPMPPNMMTGMPPPHPMMVPPGMMPPGFPPMNAGTPQQLNAAHLNLPPPNTPQFAPPPGAAPIPVQTVAPTSNTANSSSDDQMDIEMDDDDNNGAVNTSVLPPPINFNQPPPLFANNTNSSSSLNAAAGSGNETNGSDIFSRDRNRSSSRWSTGGNRGGGGDSDGDVLPDRWRENSGANFNENRNVGRPPNIPPLDLNNPPQRPDFMNDFDNRNGGRPAGGPARPPDFFPNMQQMPPNRFNQPTSLLQMRIPPPPNMFNPRMSGAGGGPMFMRGGPPPGPGGFFNARNPFNTDGGGRGNARDRGRGGGRGGRNNSHGNWSDEEGDDLAFKRRDGGRGGGGNRFRDAPDERNNRGSRRGGNDWPRGNRGDRRDFGGNRHNNARGSADEFKSMEEMSPVPNETRPRRDVQDTEEDWDRELEDYDARMAAKNKPQLVDNIENSNKNEHNDKDQMSESACENANGHEHNESQSNGNLNALNSSEFYEELPQPTNSDAALPAAIESTADASNDVSSLCAKQQENTQKATENAETTLTEVQPENNNTTLTSTEAVPE